MPAPYRDDHDALTTRLGALLDQLEAVRAQTRELTQLAQAEATIEREIETLRRQLKRATANRQLSLLDNVAIASPCPADWDSMTGDGPTRFCSQCSKNVHNLSGMSREEAETFLRGVVGDACIRIFRRTDGTVLTSDCSVGVRRKRRRRAVISVLGGSLFSASAVVGYSLGDPPHDVAQNAPTATAPEAANPIAPPSVPDPPLQEPREVVMGKRAMPSVDEQIDMQRQELTRLLGERARTSEPPARLAQEALIREAQQGLAALQTARQRRDAASPRPAR